VALVAIVGVALAERGACECACEARAERSHEAVDPHASSRGVVPVRDAHTTPDPRSRYSSSNAHVTPSDVANVRLEARPAIDVAGERSEPSCPRGGCPDDCPDCEGDGATWSALALLPPSTLGLDRPQPTWIPAVGPRGEGAPPCGVRSDVFRPPRASSIG
jgi:hypothetical protein